MSGVGRLDGCEVVGTRGGCWWQNQNGRCVRARPSGDGGPCTRRANYIDCAVSFEILEKRCTTGLESMGGVCEIPLDSTERC